MSTAARILSAGSPLSLPPIYFMTSPAADDAMSVLASAEARILGVMLSQLASETKRNADAVVAINETLHVLTRLEQGQGHVLESLKEGRITMSKHGDRLAEIEKHMPDLLKHHERLAKIEPHMPGLIETRRWVVGGVIAGVSMICLALVKLVVLDIPRIPAYLPPATVQQQPQQPPQATVPR